MGLFRRRGRDRDAEADALSADDVDAADAPVDVDAADAPVGDDAAVLPDRSNGPWDEAEHPDLEGYVDLGGLRLRGREGMELRLELDESTGAVSSATVQLGHSAVQLQAFAAPRSEGIWDEIRDEIQEGITRQGGHADEVPGPFGRELIARIPARSPDGRTGHTAARFVGVDGPRWFLRAVFSGEAVHRPEAAEVLEAVVRELVIVRGAEAMAPRELLPLRLPDAIGPQPPAQDTREELRPFERGPEITEVR